MLLRHQTLSVSWLMLTNWFKTLANWFFKKRILWHVATKQNKLPKTRIKSKTYFENSEWSIKCFADPGNFNQIWKEKHDNGLWIIISLSLAALSMTFHIYLRLTLALFIKGKSRKNTWNVKWTLVSTFAFWSLRAFKSYAYLVSISLGYFQWHIPNKHHKRRHTRAT